MSSRPPTVLLVECKQDDRQMYAEFLSVRGFRPVEIGTTDDALSLASSVDVVVTGIHVPGAFDGLELVSRIRQCEHTRHVPIVVLTACVLAGERARAENAGCDAFLTKPCLPEALVSEIRKLLGAAEAARPPKPSAPAKAQLRGAADDLSRLRDGLRMRKWHK